MSAFNEVVLLIVFLLMIVGLLSKICRDGMLKEPARVENFLNSMTLQVSVPVLSEKMYSI